MARLYADENFPRRVVGILRSLGHDVPTVQETGHANRRVGDDLVLRIATQDGRAVLTINRRDFMRFHLESQAHAGIIVCTQPNDVEQLAMRIHETLQSIDASELPGQLIRIYRGRTG